MELGGNIELIGFSDTDGSDLVVIKKIVGNFTKGLADGLDEFSSITIALKEVHREDTGPKYEVEGTVEYDGKEVISSSSDRNLYFALDHLFKQLEDELDL